VPGGPKRGASACRSRCPYAFAVARGLVGKLVNRSTGAYVVSVAVSEGRLSFVRPRLRWLGLLVKLRRREASRCWTTTCVGGRLERAWSGVSQVTMDGASARESGAVVAAPCDVQARRRGCGGQPGPEVSLLA
jgi:hypothetical protein